MRFGEVLKGANQGFVSTHTQKLAYFSFVFLRQTSLANHTTSTRNLVILGLRLG